MSLTDRRYGGRMQPVLPDGFLATMDLSDGETVIYDRENGDAWIQGEALTVGREVR